MAVIVARSTAGTAVANANRALRRALREIHERDYTEWLAHPSDLTFDEWQRKRLLGFWDEIKELDDADPSA